MLQKVSHDGVLLTKSPCFTQQPRPCSSVYSPRPLPSHFIQSTVINTATHVLQEPNLLPSITPTLGNPDTPPIPTPQPASTSNTQLPSKRAPTLQSLPEAEVEEVLDSLRLRITAMFKWAKSEVAGFEDLSPLDQKALLRRTVAELVMLGFARASIAFDGEPHLCECVGLSLVSIGHMTG